MEVYIISCKYHNTFIYSLLEVCKKCSDHYDIKRCNSLEKEILSDMELPNKEKNASK